MKNGVHHGSNLFLMIETRFSNPKRTIFHKFIFKTQNRVKIGKFTRKHFLQYIDDLRKTELKPAALVGPLIVCLQSYR